MDNFIDQAIYNSYMIIAGELTFEETEEYEKCSVLLKLKNENNKNNNEEFPFEL